jgi:hypothetical protein
MIADKMSAEGLLKVSAILSLRKSEAIRIEKIPAAEIAVSARCTKKSPQQASVAMGVPIVNAVDTPLKVLYFATARIGFTP